MKKLTRCALAFVTLWIIAGPTVPPVFAMSAHAMTLKEFRERPQAARIYMVLGAIALTGTLDLECPHAVTVGEWETTLTQRQLPVERAWTAVLLDLMDERGCGAPEVGIDPKEGA